MKTTKRLCAAFMAIILMLAFNFVALAAEGTGTITVTNATIGQSYAGYKFFDVTYADANTVSYTISEDNQFYQAVSSKESPFTVTPTTVAGKYNVARKDNVNDDTIFSWMKDQVSGKTADLTLTKATTDEVEWENVPYGYYLITSTLGATVTVNQNTPNVEIIDKNQNPGTDFNKTVDGTDDVMQIGVPFTFKLTFTATNYDGENKIEKYTVSDTFPDGMDLVEGQGNVTITINDGSEEETLNETVTLDDQSRSFTFDIAWVDENGDSLYASPVNVTVTYQAVLNADAAIEGEGETNEAKLTWTGNPEGSEVPGEETVYTYALAIKKVDNEGNGLDGAEFALKKGEEAVNVSLVSEASDKNESNVYVVDSNGNATITSPESGVIVIKGVDDASYTLTETKAPDGYNLLDGSVSVTPVATDRTTTDTTIYLDADGNVVDVDSAVTTVIITADIPATAVAVLNKAGALLPSTGGMGTTVIYIIGAVLVIGAGIVLVVRRRTNA